MRSRVTEDSYTFKPFDDNRCIFVHIPKTAGISVNQSLFGCLGGGHANIADYQMIYERAAYESYYKFAFVRNPWGRLFSAYRFLIGGGMNDSDAEWAAQFLSPYRDFEDFVIRGLDHEMIWRYIHFRPQYQFICLPHTKSISVDFVGLYENMPEDFEHVRHTLGLRAEVSLRRDNVSSSAPLDYREAYTDKMSEVVAEVYREDIALLGYDFDNTTLDAMRRELPRA